MARKKKKKEVVEQPEEVNSSVNESKTDLLESVKKYLPYIGLGIIMIISFFFRSKFNEIPFERDEGVYTYLGQLFLDGKTPYIDYGVQKFPGIFYSYALLLTLFGHTVEGIHTAFNFVNLLSIGLIFWVGKQLFNNIGGLGAALAFVIFSLNPFASGFTVQSEHLVSLFVIAGLGVMLHAFKKQKWYWYVFSGVLMCYSLLVKPSGAFYIVAIGLALVLHHFYEDPKNWKKLIVDGLLYSAGVFGLYGLIVLIVYMQGAFDDMWYWTVTVPSFYVNQISAEQGKQLRDFTFSRIFEYNKWWWYASFAGLATFFALNYKKYKAPFIVILLILGYWTVTPGKRYYGHYWIQMMPALAVAAGAFIYSVQSFLEKKWNKTGSIAIAVVLLVVLFMQEKNNHPNYYGNPNYTGLLRNVYSSNPFPEAKVIGDYIKERTTEEDQIVVFGSEPQIYFYTNRRCPNNRFYLTHIMRDTTVFPEMREEQLKFIKSVEAAKPKYLVFFDHPISWLANPKSDQSIFKWFNPWANQNYDLVGLADMVSNFETKYIWENQLKGYQPKGQYRIRVYKRRKPIASTP